MNFQCNRCGSKESYILREQLTCKICDSKDLREIDSVKAKHISKETNLSSSSKLSSFSGYPDLLSNSKNKIIAVTIVLILVFSYILYKNNQDKKQFYGKAAAVSILLKLKAELYFETIQRRVEWWNNFGVDQLKYFIVPPLTSLDEHRFDMNQIRLKKDININWYLEIMELHDTCNEVYKLALDETGYSLLTYSQEAERLRTKIDSDFGKINRLARTR
jgi:hypothetical protein